jgi:hypothetical protein
MNMIEQVARAISREVGHEPDRDYVDVKNKLTKGWKLHEGQARASIEALREPSAAMLGTLSDAIADGVSDEKKWQRVVDAALKPDA